MRHAILRLRLPRVLQPGRRRSSRRLAIEALEDRSLLSTGYGYGPSPPPATPPHHLGPHHPGQADHFRARFRHGHALGPNAYQQINLVSDFPTNVEGINPQLSDRLMLNPWGLVASPTSPWWISDQVTGTSTVYAISGGTVTKVPLNVTIPSLVTQPAHGFNPLTGPTGIVANTSTTDFMLPGAGGKSVPALFIFSTLDGSLAGWNPGSTGGPSTAVVIPSTIKAPVEEFTGLATASSGGSQYVYTVDPRMLPGIDVFNSSWNQVTLAGNFTDPRLPAGLSAYGIQNIGGNIYVSYIATSSGGGAVAEFNPDGTFMRQVAVSKSGGPLESPWGMTMAPSNFGRFSNDLLVGNFGDGRISAFNPRNGRFLGQLANQHGQPIVIPFLWGLQFGNGQKAGPTNVLYFTAGIAGQYHGVFGALVATHRVR